MQCFRMQDCVGLLQTDITARECCLSDDGAFFPSSGVIEQCRTCRGKTFTDYMCSFLIL